MGLVLQAPTDALLPLADATAAAAPTPAQTAAAADGLFASLLASFTGSLDPQAPETGAPSALTPALADVPVAPPEETEDDSDAFAALAALTATLPQTVPLTAQQPEAAGGTAGEPIAAVAPNTTEAPSELVESVAAAPAAPGDATQDAPRITAAPEVTSDPVEAVAIAGAEQAAATLTGEAPLEGPGAKPQQPHHVEASPPTEAQPGEPPTVASVVRPVGNAETDPEHQAEGNAFGRKGHEMRPAPRASETGLLHAAPNSAVGEVRAAQDASPVEAPVVADPAPTAEVPPQVEHVARTVIERFERGGGEARIHLDPAGLGEVTIRVHTQGDHVRVDVHAERHEAMQLLRDHTQDLSTLLGDRGLNLSDVNVGLGRGNGEQAWGQEQSGRNRTVSGEFAGILGLEETAALETHHRLRAAYNPDGALLYRV